MYDALKNMRAVRKWKGRVKRLCFDVDKVEAALTKARCRLGFENFVVGKTLTMIERKQKWEGEVLSYDEGNRSYKVLWEGCNSAHSVSEKKICDYLDPAIAAVSFVSLLLCSPSF